MEERLKVAEILNEQLGLTPYESRAYVSLMTYGPMSPSELARKSGIPRPRTYDVLRSLMERGLLMEQSGRPSIYAAVEPAQGLKNLLVRIEMDTLRQLESKRRATEKLTKTLSQMYEKSKGLKVEKSKVWFTRRDAAFISIYCEAIRSYRKELLVASRDPYIPEKEILEAVEFALKNGRSVRVVREITDSWTLKDLERYEQIIRAGSQVRYLKTAEIPLRFSVFDEKDVILVFPPRPKAAAPQTIEALWLRIPSLARILSEHFEELWTRSKPMLPVLKEIREKKQSGNT